MRIRYAPPFVEEVQRCVSLGGNVFLVYAKNGRWITTHRILITAKGAVFFPDHGMATPPTLMAELALCANQFEQLSRDYCYVLAALLVDGSFLSNVPKSFVHIPKERNWSRVPNEMRKRWSEKGHAFVVDLNEKRRKRRLKSSSPVDPVTDGIPISISIQKRIRCIEDERHARVLEKLARVTARLGHRPLPYYI